jgi:hypothetical protein
MDLYVGDEYSDTREQLLNHTKIAFHALASLASQLVFMYNEAIPGELNSHGKYT